MKHVSETRVLLTVELAAAELADAEKVALVRLAKTLKVPGFRKGHVPANVAAKYVDPQALTDEIMNTAVSKAVALAYTEHDLMPLDRPEVVIKKFVPAEQLEFTAEGDVLPEVKLGDYKKLKATKKPVKIDKKDVDDVIGRIQQQFATKTEVKRAAKLTDEVIIDYIGTKDKTAFDGGTATDAPLALGSNQFIPGFEEAIVGHKPGDKFDIPLSFPKDYHSEELAGKKVVFAVTLNKVNETTLPKLDDEFAAKVGEFTSMADLRKDINNELTAQKDREAMDDLRDELIQQLVSKSKVGAPKVLVEDQLKSIKQDMLQNLMYRGATLDQYIADKGYKDLADWEAKEAAPLAEKRVMAGLVLNQLAKELNVEVTEAALDERVESFRNQYANDPEMVKRFDEPEVRQDIANRLATELTVDALVALNLK